MAVGRVFCAAASSARGEPIAATASRVDHWILVEYRGGWARDLLGGSLLSPELKAHLREQREALGHARVLFLRQPERRAESRRRVFVARSTPGEARLVGREVEHPEDLRGFDFAAALAGEPVDEPLFLVCTHGKRDRCCARYGRPLYDTLRSRADRDRIWQSSHVGGDRFAGNVVVLPHGLYYGRVGPDGVGTVLAATAAGQVDLAHYRGRSVYSFPVQAAEHAVREHTGALGIDDLRIVGVETRDDDAWRVRFRVREAADYEVEVVATLADEPAYSTCSSTEPRRARRYLARVVSS